jgi:hypothetical protein
MIYQTKSFTCQLCGITFTVESDSQIANQKYCSECIHSGHRPDSENGRAVKRPPKKP